MNGCCALSGLSVIGKLMKCDSEYVLMFSLSLSVLSFSNKINRHESNVHPSYRPSKIP